MTQSPIRYKRLGFVSLQVTHLQNSIEFYTNTVGLELVSANNDVATLRCSDKPYDIELRTGQKPGLICIGMELENDAAMVTAFDFIQSLNYRPKPQETSYPQTDCIRNSFEFSNPDTGLKVVFYHDQQSTLKPFIAPLAAIERLGHIVLNVSSYDKAHKFWVEDLGFAISDHVPGKIAFLRAFPNPLHHSLALISGDQDGLNHVNFMVTDIDDIGTSMNRFKKSDVPIVFGPGRHLPSTSIFLYFLDPDGLTAEYSFGMEEIPELNPRNPRKLEPKAEVLDTWGSIPDPRFGARGIIVASHE